MSSPSEKRVFVYEHLSKLLTYHPLTGLMYWKQRPKSYGGRGGWHPLKPAGSISGQGYRQLTATICGKPHDVKQHNLAWFIAFGKIPKEGFSIDHKNNQRLDNRLENLRVLSHCGQAISKSKVRNLPPWVYWRKNLNKYSSRIVVKGKLKYLGHFTIPWQGHTKAADFAIKNGLISADEYALLIAEWKESQGGQQCLSFGRV
tara:strand:+ start:185 stop:790 length:606 start_codon:yes stop_codon:yes gene_type:complete